MLRLFNRNFFKFSLGFLGMLLFGLLGIIITVYFDSTEHQEKNSASEAKEVRAEGG